MYPGYLPMMMSFHTTNNVTFRTILTMTSFTKLIKHYQLQCTVRHNIFTRQWYRPSTWITGAGDRDLSPCTASEAVGETWVQGLK